MCKIYKTANQIKVYNRNQSVETFLLIYTADFHNNLRLIADFIRNWSAAKKWRNSRAKSCNNKWPLIFECKWARHLRINTYFRFGSGDNKMIQRLPLVYVVYLCVCVGMEKESSSRAASF